MTPKPGEATPCRRRDIVAGTLCASVLALLPRSATAAKASGASGASGAASRHMDNHTHAGHRPMSITMTDAEVLDRIRVEDVLLRERAARDGGRWDEMAGCYHPESRVEVSWYQGPGAGFVERTKVMARGPVQTFHLMGQSVVTLRGDRALADTECTIHGILQIDGCEMDIVSISRLLWRVRKHEGQWLIAGLRSLYIRDMLLPLNPNRVPQLDQDLLATLRPSYRYIAYTTAKAGHAVPDDLPGVDRPELEAALRLGEQDWLDRG